MFYLPTILASLHHIAAFTLVACLVYEWLTFRQTIAAHEARGLQRIDLWYGVSAVMLLVAGVLRVIYGGKGYQFYVESTLFWVKMALVLIISILSIYPTIRYIRWGTIAKVAWSCPMQSLCVSAASCASRSSAYCWCCWWHRPWPVGWACSGGMDRLVSIVLRLKQTPSACALGVDWYGRRESNSRHELGRLLRYHYATPA